MHGSLWERASSSQFLLVTSLLLELHPDDNFCVCACAGPVAQTLHVTTETPGVTPIVERPRERGSHAPPFVHASALVRVTALCEETEATCALLFLVAGLCEKDIAG